MLPKPTCHYIQHLTAYSYTHISCGQKTHSFLFITFAGFKDGLYKTVT